MPGRGIWLKNDHRLIATGVFMENTLLINIKNMNQNSIVIINLPTDDTKTTPKPIAKGPPQLMKRSDGAVTATSDKEPTIPPVYKAA